jgi:hypothetical protein
VLAAPGAIIKVWLQRIIAVLAPQVFAEGVGHTLERLYLLKYIFTDCPEIEGG